MVTRFLIKYLKSEKKGCINMAKNAMLDTALFSLHYNSFLTRLCTLSLNFDNGRIFDVQQFYYPCTD